MGGTLADGDVLFLDRSHDTVRTDAIYALVLDNDVFVRSVQRKVDGGNTLTDHASLPVSTRAKLLNMPRGLRFRPTEWPHWSGMGRHTVSAICALLGRPAPSFAPPTR